MIALVQTLMEAGSQGAPSGPMYSALSEKGVSLPMYQSIVDTLKEQGYVKEVAHVLYWNS